MAINSLSSASKGMSGLASGMDTQSMVDAMLAGTQSKIDKQKASKTQWQYKQTMYRDMTSMLSGFRSKFLLPGGANNLNTSSFYNSMNAVSKANAFRATATGNAPAGKTVVNSISQLARAYQMKTANKVTGEVKGKLDRAKLAGQELQIDLDGVRKTIKLPGADVVATMDDEGLRKAIQKSINDAFGNGINVGGTDGEITFSAEPSREFIIMGNGDAMSVVGLPTGTSNKLNANLRLSQLNFATDLAGDSFKFTINGKEFSFSGSDDLASVMKKINDSDANVRVRYSALDDKFIMESTVSGEKTFDPSVPLKDRHGIDISQTEGNLLTAMFGKESGGGVAGGPQYSYGDMAGKVCGVRVDYTPGTPLSDEDYKKVQDVMGIVGADLDRMTKDADLEMKFIIDGKEVMVTLPKRADDTVKYTIDDLIDKMNTNATFVAKGINISLDYETDADGGKLTDGRLTGGVKVTVPEGVKFEINGLVQSFFGIDANNAKASTKDTTLKQAGFKGNFSFDITNDKGVTTKVDLTADMSLEKAAEAIKNGITAAGGAGAEVVYEEKDGKGAFRIFGVDIPMTFEMKGESSKLFGTEEIKLGQGITDGYTEITGQNAKMKINGIDVERNSNEFTVDGMSYTLVSTFNEANEASKEETVDVTRDTTKILDGITKFMEEYNKIVDKAWGMLKSEATYKEYPPLTDKQKEAMSDREVELWESKSKEGILRGDKLLDGIMNTMRTTLLARPDGAKYSLAEMGITVGYDIEKGYGGMLKFSDGGEDKLKKIIAEEPGEIESLFADYDNGIMTELNKVLMGATMTSPVESPREYGELSLVNMAGIAGLDTSSTIYSKVRDINTNLESLTTKYKLEYARYWKQFSAMEQSISSLNSQSSWLSQQFQ